MATKKEAFKSLDEFKKLLLSKEKFEYEDIQELFSLYIDSVGYFHFKEKIKGKRSDEDINIKLKGVYEMFESIKTIINEDAKKVVEKPTT